VDTVDEGPLQPGQAWLGMLGGGQLGRMFVHAAQALGYRVLVLEPDAASPAGAAADDHIVAGYEDRAALAALASRCAAVSTEFENVPASSLQFLAGQPRLHVAPAAGSVSVCQHRAREKALFVRSGVPCATHAPIETESDLAQPGLEAMLPGLLKTSSMGYDGKGQITVESLAALGPAWRRLGAVPCLLEQRLPLARELSVVVARGHDGRCVHLPVQQNLHRDGILAVTQVPAPDVPPAAADAAVDHALRLADALGHVGVLCVEFFLLADGRLVANEMAPRPHNSGHHSIDSCDLSQFDLQVRAMARLPLAAPRLHSAAVMLNLLGDLWLDAAGAPRRPDWAAVLALQGAHLHLYGKAEARRGRQMGHLTLTASGPASALAAAREAAARLGLAPP